LFLKKLSLRARVVESKFDHLSGDSTVFLSES